MTSCCLTTTPTRLLQICENKKETSMKKLLPALLITLALVLAHETAQAQFGFGVVYDPTNYANAVLRYSQLVQQLSQLRATYVEILNQYNLALQMSRNLPNMASRYTASWAPWRYAKAQDAYGNTSAGSAV